MSREEEYSTFIAGWKACSKKFLADIKQYSEPWLQNGPSLATAQAISKRLEAIPAPKSEDAIDGNS